MVQTKHITIFTPYLAALLITVSGLIGVGFHQKTFSFIVLLISAVVCLNLPRASRYLFLSLIISVSILNLTPIDTSLTITHIVQMSAALIAAIVIPWYVSARVIKKPIIAFPWHHGRRWLSSEILYIFITAAIAYLLLPFYFENTNAHLNWAVETDIYNLTLLFIGTNALGIWDELFFIATVLAIFRSTLPFWIANLLQAVLFTSFLYELGFTGWAPFVLYPFALLQGLIFKKTESLLYVITVHLTLDFVLFLALINAHHPHLVNIFIT